MVISCIIEQSQSGLTIHKQNNGTINLLAIDSIDLFQLLAIIILEVAGNINMKISFITI